MPLAVEYCQRGPAVYLLVTGVVGAAAFVGLLVLLVQWVLVSGVAR